PDRPGGDPGVPSPMPDPGVPGPDCPLVPGPEVCARTKGAIATSTAMTHTMAWLNLLGMCVFSSHNTNYSLSPGYLLARNVGGALCRWVQRGHHASQEISSLRESNSYATCAGGAHVPQEMPHTV